MREHHAHGCERCSRRYTDNCQTSPVDGICFTCRTGHPRLLWELDSDPVACCYTHSRLASVAELFKFALAGASAWHICAVCARTHPYPLGPGRRAP